MPVEFNCLVAVAFEGRSAEGDACVLTAHLGTSAAWAAIASEAVCDAIFDALMAPILVVMKGDSGYLYHRTVMRNITAGNAAEMVESATNSGDPAEGIGNPAPVPLAWIMQKHTATSGRSGRGRLYVPYFNRDWVDAAGNFGDTGDLATATVRTAWATDFLVPGVEGDVTMVNVVCRRNQIYANPVTVCENATIVGVQRRRRPGIGV